MSILSDRTITRRSMLPTHRVTTDAMYSGWAWENLGDCPPGDTSKVAEGVVTGYIRVNDLDIQAFNQEHPWFPMLDPFLPAQEAYTRRPFTDMEKLEYLNDSEYAVNFPTGSLVEQVGNDYFLKEKVISSGVTSYGYDVKCADEFKIFTNINSCIIDPKNFDPKIFVDHKGPYCIIPPNSFVLARTVEWFKIPRNVLVVCLGKSTYARCGIVVNVTPLEPEWEGHVTLEFSNTTPLPAKIYANEGVAQMLFFEGDEECMVSYKDRGGKYQGQSGVVVPRMK